MTRPMSMLRLPIRRRVIFQMSTPSPSIHLPCHPLLGNRQPCLHHLDSRQMSARPGMDTWTGECPRPSLLSSSYLLAHHRVRPHRLLYMIPMLPSYPRLCHRSQVRARLCHRSQVHPRLCHRSQVRARPCRSHHHRRRLSHGRPPS